MQVQEIAKMAELSSFNIKTCPNFPILFPGAFKESEAVKHWSPNYLASLFGSKEVKVGTAPGGIHSLDPKTGRLKGGVQSMPFRSFVKKIIADKEEAQSLYLQQMCIQDIMPSLHSDVDLIIKTFNYATFFYPDLWLGTKYSFVPLHFDEPNNFLIQIYGKKRFLLFSPMDSKYLYMKPFYSQTVHISEIDTNIDPEKLDLSKFPNLENTRPIEIILEAGDVLYIPPYWWHQVQGLSVNISVTYRWKCEFRQVPINFYFFNLGHHLYKKLFRIRKQ